MAFTIILYYTVSILVSYLLLWATYQVFFHPLSKYPGPLVAKFSDIYSGFYAFKKCLHLTTWSNQLKYGPIIRQGPNKLVFNTTTALRDIYKNGRTTKPKAYIALGPGLTRYNVITAVDSYLHRSRRQLVGQAITERSMRVFEPTMIEQVNIFVRNLLYESRRSNAVNMTKKARLLGLNVAGILSFGYDLNLQTEEENHFMLTVLDGGTFGSNIFLHYPSVRRLRRLGLGFLMRWSMSNLREKYLRLMETMITSRMTQAKDAKHDLFSFVAEALDTAGGDLRQSDLWSEANLFLLAGGDTVKTALSATFFYLSRNPDCYQKLANEIRSTFTSDSGICGSGVAGCLYLRACIDEALRLSPPSPGILWRELSTSHEGSDLPFIVDGHVIPHGTIVGINTYSIHHKEEYFPDPFTYNPDRWLGSSSFPPETSQIMRDAFAPFSIGPRGCAGKAMAYLEINLTLAKTLWYFDFEPAPGELGKLGAGKLGSEEGRERQGEFQLYDCFVATHEGPYLTFKIRDDFWKELSETKAE